MTGVIQSFSGECGIILNDNGRDVHRFFVDELIDVLDINDDVEYTLDNNGFAINIVYQMEL